ncbi:MATE family efflux transporter [Novosphingobium arvoryzae]|uniref:Multidrug-efflux transporter n=1 Tax=Novosphingobium arvoryzae TaxID=1256514 RepID=A0A918VLB0_9SPHN|nr:MATE family efflux transporter [Novosphingobium arvoryzae]GHA05768.1 multidrug resistance protein NorM [Novosphingobium arvoryzae]
MAEPAAPSLWRTELGATLRLAAPLAAANLLQMLVYAIDVIFVARLGETALAASSLATTLFGLMMWCLIGLTGACAPLIAAELGRRAHAVREVRRSVRMALWLAAGTGLLAMLVSANGEALLLLSGQDAEVARQAGSFLAILLWATIPNIMAGVLRNFVSALGRPVFATAITGLAILVNALGNYVLVFGNWGAPALGLDGSAISSVITAFVMLGAYALAIRTDRRLRRYRVFGRWWRPEWQRLRDLLRIGLPISLIIMAEGGLFSSAAFLMGLLGQAELAGHTVALQVAALAFQIPFGVGQAATIRVGYHYGAGNVAAIAAAGKAALVVAVSYMIIPAALMILAPRFVLSLYVDPADPANAAMVGHAVGFLAIAAAFQLFDGLQAVLAGTLRGLQDTRMPLILALIGYWLIGFTTSVALGFFSPLAGNGIWLGLAAGLVVVSLLLGRRWQRRAVLGLVPA